jgi:hypothetical protein
VNHHVVEQAPGDGRFSRRPLLGANEFVFNTNRRRVETGSNGQEKPAGLALLDGVMDQFHERDIMAVQPALRSKPGTPRSTGRHRATKRIIRLSGTTTKECGETREYPVELLSCQAPVEEAPLSGIVPRQRRRRQRRKQLQKFMQEGNEKQKTLQGGGAPLTIATGALFSISISVPPLPSRDRRAARRFDDPALVEER